MKFMRAFLLMLIIPLGLSACVPVIIAGGAAATTGVIVYDKRPMSQIITDRKITGRANYLLRHNPQLANKAHISVGVFNGVVLLIGQVRTQQQSDIAYKIVNQIAHVRKIYNQIKVMGSKSFMSHTNDAWITTKIKAQMIGTPGLRSGQIKVLTNNGNVYLMGLVTHSQAKLASSAARKVGGVAQVITVFEYIQ